MKCDLTISRIWKKRRRVGVRKMLANEVEQNEHHRGTAQQSWSRVLLRAPLTKQSAK